MSPAPPPLVATVEPGCASDLPEIAVVSDASLDEWQEAYDHCDAATFFHGPLWSEVWASYSDGRFQPAPRQIEFADGSTAILGITEEHTRFGVTRHHLSPAGCYGGWVSARTLTDRHESAIVHYVLTEQSIAWRAAPVEANVLLRNSAAVSDDFTHVIDLNGGAAAARARWRASARNKVRRARKSGVRVRVAASRADWAAYNALYREALSRWGSRVTVVYRPSLFELLERLDSPDVRLWLAELDGVPCAGDVIFTHGTHAVNWHGASAPATCPGARNLLQWDLCELLAEAGIKTYDLNPSGGLPGVAAFKSSLGAEQRPAPFVRRRHWREPVAERIRGVLQRGRTG